VLYSSPQYNHNETCREKNPLCDQFASLVTAAGFSTSVHNLTLFVHMLPCGRTFLILYVHDKIIIGGDSEYIDFVNIRLSD
jgi:hypothetical protein